MNTLLVFIGYALTVIGIVLLTFTANKMGYKEGSDEYRYVSNEATYETTINGKKVEYAYGKINDLIRENEEYLSLGIEKPRIIKIMDPSSKKALFDHPIDNAPLDNN